MSRRGQNIIIYEPLFLEKAYETLPVVSDFKEFMDMCDLVVANRVDDLLVGYEDKVYSRDIYSVD